MVAHFRPKPSGWSSSIQVYQLLRHPKDQSLWGHPKDQCLWGNSNHCHKQQVTPTSSFHHPQLLEDKSSSQGDQHSTLHPVQRQLGTRDLSKEVHYILLLPDQSLDQELHDQQFQRLRFQNWFLWTSNTQTATILDLPFKLRFIELQLRFRFLSNHRQGHNHRLPFLSHTFLLLQPDHHRTKLLQPAHQGL